MHLQMMSIILKIKLLHLHVFCVLILLGDCMTIGERIEAIAKEKNINLHKLASLSCIPYNTLYSIVRRKSNRVDYSILENISDSLQISVTDLLSEDAASAYRHGLNFGYEGGRKENEMYMRFFKNAGYCASKTEMKLISAFSTLNQLGQQKAVERVEELAEITKYQQKPEKDTPNQDKK